MYHETSTGVYRGIVMAGPSQPKVTDEIWNDDRVRDFLEMEPYGRENADFHVLLKAYRGMRSNDFVRFLSFFSETGRNLDAKDSSGRTLWTIITDHRHALPFLEARKKLKS